MGNSISCFDPVREHPPYSWPKDHPGRAAAIAELKKQRRSGLVGVAASRFVSKGVSKDEAADSEANRVEKLDSAPDAEEMAVAATGKAHDVDEVRTHEVRNSEDGTRTARAPVAEDAQIVSNSANAEEVKAAVETNDEFRFAEEVKAAEESSDGFDSAEEVMAAEETNVTKEVHLAQEEAAVEKFTMRKCTVEESAVEKYDVENSAVEKSTAEKPVLQKVVVEAVAAESKVTSKAEDVDTHSRKAFEEVRPVDESQKPFLMEDTCFANETEGDVLKRDAVRRFSAEDAGDAEKYEKARQANSNLVQRREQIDKESHIEHTSIGISDRRVMFEHGINDELPEVKSPMRDVMDPVSNEYMTLTEYRACQNARAQGVVKEHVEKFEVAEDEANMEKAKLAAIEEVRNEYMVKTEWKFKSPSYRDRSSLSPPVGTTEVGDTVSGDQTNTFVTEETANAGEEHMIAPEDTKVSADETAAMEIDDEVEASGAVKVLYEPLPST